MNHGYPGSSGHGTVSASLEKAISELECSPTQEHIWSLIQAFQTGCDSNSDLYVPTLEKEGDDLWKVEKLSLDKEESTAGDSVFRKVEMQKGGMAFCAFTSEKEMQKGQDTEFEQLPMENVLQQAWKDDSVLGIVINPWGLSVLLDKKLLGLILKPAGSQHEQNSSIYIERADISEIPADVILDVETAQKSREKLPKSDQADADREWQKNSNLSITRGDSVAADYMLHLVIPSAEDFLEDESLLIGSIHSALDKAQSEGFKTIAMPAAKGADGTYPLTEALPVLVLAVAGWLNDHPEAEMEITLVCPNEEIFKTLNEYLFD